MGKAVNQSGPTLWQPFGPYASRVVITVYSDFAAMFTAFENGEVDLTDWQVEIPTTQATYGANPDFFLTSALDELGIFELDINHHAPFLGIQMQENRGPDSFTSPSTKQPSAAGVEIRRALAHLLDKPDLINVAALQGQGKYVDVQAPPAQGLSIGGAAPSRLPAAILAEDCSEHPWYTPCDVDHPPVSAYNLVADSLPDPFAGFVNHGWSGSEDLRAACDHFVLAGISITPSGASCADVASGAAKLVSGGQTVKFFIRSHAPRKAFGTIIFDAMNYLFDQRVAFNGCISVQCIFSPVIFDTTDKDDWNLYTGGWGLGSLPDHLYQVYHSLFASNACGGKKNTFANNYVFFCSPEYDQEASAGQFAPSVAEAAVHFSNAALVAHRNVMTIPVYSGAGLKYVALNGWNGLVFQFGKGFGGDASFWSFLNMRCKDGFVPADGRYRPGGGDCSTIRRGFSQEVHKLNPFQATSAWDLEVLHGIYDSMLRVNPLTGGLGQQAIDWMTVRHTSSYDATVNVTTQVWTLRNDLQWHDGVPVTASDVAYTILAHRDVSCLGLLLPCISPVLGASAVDSRTVQVKLSGRSFFDELDIGTLPILPKHVWAPVCGDPASASSPCADPAFDPMSAGMMVGSGPFACVNVQTGQAGGTCTQTATGAPGTQDVTANGKIILTSFDGYSRGRPGLADSSIHKFSWADANNDGLVNILDIAGVALQFGLSDAYWNTGENPAAPQSVGTDPSRVDIAEIATVAFYFDHGLVRPFTVSSTVGLNPDIDPFF